MWSIPVTPFELAIICWFGLFLWECLWASLHWHLEYEVFILKRLFLAVCAVCIHCLSLEVRLYDALSIQELVLVVFSEFDGYCRISYGGSVFVDRIGSLVYCTPIMDVLCRSESVICREDRCETDLVC